MNDFLGPSEMIALTKGTISQVFFKRIERVFLEISMDLYLDTQKFGLGLK